MLIQAIFQFPCYFADSGKDIINYANAFKNIDSMHQHSKASLSPQQSCQSVVSWFKLMGLSYYLRVLLCKLFVEYCLSIVLITLKKMLCCSLSLVDFRNVSSIMFHVYQTKSEKIDRLLARGKVANRKFLDRQVRHRRYPKNSLKNWIQWDWLHVQFGQFHVQTSQWYSKFCYHFGQDRKACSLEKIALSKGKYRVPTHNHPFFRGFCLLNRATPGDDFVVRNLCWWKSGLLQELHG